MSPMQALDYLTCLSIQMTVRVEIRPSGVSGTREFLVFLRVKATLGGQFIIVW